MSGLKIYEELKEVVEEKVALKIAHVITEAVAFYEKMVTKEEFNELKAVLKELAEAQKRTEAKVEELAEAQKRTEARVEELAEAQKKTEVAILEFTKGLKNLRKDFGGFSLTMSYAFENEAFKHLPKVLEQKYKISVEEKFIRQEVGEKEINIFAKGKMNGEQVYIIGESKLRLEEKEFYHILSELNEKEEAVKEELGDVKVAKILITHYAKKGFIKKAEGEGVIVVQSFEW